MVYLLGSILCSGVRWGHGPPVRVEVDIVTVLALLEICLISLVHLRSLHLRSGSNGSGSDTGSNTED